MCATRAKSICRHAGCGKAIEAPGYCEKHQKDATGWNRSHGDKSSTDRGYGYEWQKLRQIVLRRDMGLCRCDECKASGRIRVAHEVDHRIPKASGGTDDLDNLSAINRECHALKTQKERKITV